MRGKYYNTLSSTEEFILEKQSTLRRIAMQEKKYELSKDDKFIFSILEKTAKEYERYLELSSLGKLKLNMEVRQIQRHDWTRPLGLVIRKGE